MNYLTPCGTKAYSGLLAKLATRIAKMSKGAPAARLRQIYNKVYFDEVQDLVGWDYDVIKSLSKTLKEGMCCVGDFRQTIYSTTLALPRWLFGQPESAFAVPNCDREPREDQTLLPC